MCNTRVACVQTRQISSLRVDLSEKKSTRRSLHAEVYTQRSTRRLHQRVIIQTVECHFVSLFHCSDHMKIKMEFIL